MKIAASALVCGALLSGYATAGGDNGHVTYKGTILAAPCYIDPAFSEQVVNVGTYSTASGADPDFSAPYTTYNIPLKGVCNATTVKGLDTDVGNEYWHTLITNGFITSTDGLALLSYYKSASNEFVAIDLHVGVNVAPQHIHNNQFQLAVQPKQLTDQKLDAGEYTSQLVHTLILN
ncbi:fimbrial protein [Aeromonas piscicola]